MGYDNMAVIVSPSVSYLLVEKSHLNIHLASHTLPGHFFNFYTKHTELSNFPKTVIRLCLTIDHLDINGSRTKASVQNDVFNDPKV